MSSHPQAHSLIEPVSDDKQANDSPSPLSSSDLADDVNPPEGVEADVEALSRNYPLSTSLRLVQAWVEDDWSAVKAEELRAARCHDILLFRYLLEPQDSSSIDSLDSLVKILERASFQVPSELPDLLRRVKLELHKLTPLGGHLDRVTAIIAGEADQSIR